MKRLALLAAIATTLAGHAADAHAFLKSAVPGVGATVPTPPTKVVIDFTEGVDPAFSSIAVLDAKGTRVDSGILQPGASDQELAVTLDKLPPGTYRVVWHVTAVDTHKTEGSYSFTIGP